VNIFPDQVIKLRFKFVSYLFFGVQLQTKNMKIHITPGLLVIVYKVYIVLLFNIPVRIYLSNEIKVTSQETES